VIGSELVLVLVLVIGPLGLALAGIVSSRRGAAAPEPSAPHDWRLPVGSALLYALAFNATYFVQELFLVLPKALLPGVRATLFHNNHHWEGEHPLTALFQGTGALAILVTGTACAVLARRRLPGSPTLRLLLVWMAYAGWFEALPQIVLGTVSHQSDVGVAFDYLGLGTVARAAVAFLALAAMPPAALWLTRPLLGLADHPAQIATGGARTRFIWWAATLPLLASVALIVPFRVPRDAIEVVGLPLVVNFVGGVWMQAGAWRVRNVAPDGGAQSLPIAYLLGAVALLLAVFQLVLRRGIAFY
jgi:hypothetical protein